jgi:cytochrome c-type biogenesis protein
MLSVVDIAVALGGGLVSFASPCVLPLIPGYLSLLTGLSVKELQSGNGVPVGKTLGATGLFVLGFSVVFTALGASASALGGLLAEHQRALARASGVLVILMGLFVMGIVRIPILYREKRAHLSAKAVGGPGLVLLGMAFAFGWTPCVGPVLASILAYAGSTQTVARGALLLLVYSLGLGVPFMLTGLALSRALVAFQWVKRHYTAINYASGALLVAMGVLLLTNKMTYISALALRWGG